ncbi:hypothetical protein HPB48_016673 [Haemaphysalis longicornis]|uniref:Uncharacterized protein n=1 Tax=Haemaphysalis longicornis TaxID=44386 RepID=A0A9J6H1Y8_HAELO|nr:hypothetical protein HPB48_016673 [Haemaphysalis longicornis]
MKIPINRTARKGGELYVTVTNLGHDPLSLSLVGRSCCQEVAPGDVDCDDPTRSCTPVLCDIKYNGVRNYFNETSQRCEPTANCWDDAEGEEMVTFEAIQ